MMKSTTFGVRDLTTNAWSFYSLSYGSCAFSKKFDHDGCFQLV